MIITKLDYTIEKVLQDKNANGQTLLKELTGRKFARTEAETLWKKIENHKWLLSEKLGRDVGNRVAALDFVENFYKFPTTPKHAN